MVFESNLSPANGSIALLQVNLTVKRENFFFSKKTKQKNNNIFFKDFVAFLDKI